MVRGFSEEERSRIHSQILDAARTTLAAEGYMKVTIRSLAQAVGISVGTFYLFFASKEELLFAVLEREEQVLKQQLFSEGLLKEPLTRRSLADFLQKAFTLAHQNPIIRQAVNAQVYQKMTAGISPETMAAHAAQDQMDLTPLLKHWRHQGRLTSVDDAVLSGALRAVFLLSLHEDVIGAPVFEDVVSFWINALAAAVVVEEG